MRKLFTTKRFSNATVRLSGLALLLACSVATAAQDVKRPEEVFRYDTRVEDGAVIVAWDIEEGYYLYRDKMSFTADSETLLGDPQFPAGEIHSDEFFGEQVIFRNRADVAIPLERISNGTQTLQLAIKSQGCADFGLCYPPQTWNAEISLPSLISSAAAAESNFDFPFGATATDDQPVPVDEAFRALVTTPDPFTADVAWSIAPGYYLYRNSFTVSNPGGEVQLGTPSLPRGVMEMDVEFGETEVYYDEVVMRVPISRASPDPLFIELKLGFQGCKKGSICYPPDMYVAGVDLPRATAEDAMSERLAPISEQDRLFGVVTDASLPAMMFIFLGLGLLLAFTPCCLPMVPILSGIIAGQGENVTTARAFWLSLSYVLGMAFTYTIAGAVFGAAGGQIQAALQTPAIITGVAILFIVLSLAMFGVYELQMPASLQTHLSALGSKGKAGSFIGTAVMGAVSALVVSTCVAPPLVAALAVIAQTGDVARGAFALFSLSIGMGIPLLIFGVSAGKLLPKAGAWMNTVKGIFGFMLLGLAIWMLDRILPGTVIMALWAALALFAGAWSGAFQGMARPASGGTIFGKLAGILLAIYGGLLVIGTLTGATNPLQPLSRISGITDTHPELKFERIKTVDDFEAARLAAAAASQPLMLDFYADWCVSCKEMEAWTFTDQRVHDALANTVLVQADVTANDDADQALLEYFSIFGPPTIVFYDRTGNEVKGQRVIGYKNSDDFLSHLDYVLR
ncbi:MAG: thiol:disulfide interchange protein [Chromatiales bacterium]|jgi:thiol:disulfide interchange protein DsbD|nr:thiol:disulfide interchange protein [Chromatiales bacterium]MDP7270312.1 protein-disulfide reductase DsbD [Gammaproteobacteria bacterium]HJP05250.1 protein-disulfide reductase DsbD [Gammaproteobacteria bacterium]